MLFKNEFVESIRILPNDKGTFKTEEEFETFMGKKLINRGGYYYFPSQMMSCPDNTLVLFQYAGKIRAVGILIESKKIKTFDEEGNEYAGYYKFDTNTIYIIGSPINKEQMQNRIPEFRNFNQSKQVISLNYLEEILEMLSDNK